MPEAAGAASAPATGSAGTLDDDIRSAIATVNKAAEPPPAATNGAAESAGAQDGAAATVTGGEGEKAAGAQARDERGRFAGRDGKAAPAQDAAAATLEGAETTTEGGEGEAAPEPAKAAVEPPKHWSNRDKAKFGELAKLSPDHASWLLDRHRSMESLMDRKIGEAQAVHAQAKPILDIFAPHTDELAMAGTTPAQVVQRWAAVERRLQNPQTALQTVVDVINAYGIDISPLLGQAAGQGDGVGAGAGEAGAGMPDISTHPAFQKLARQLNSVTGMLSNAQRAQAQHQQTLTVSRIEQFVDEVDAKGQPAHPYFDELLPDIEALAKADRLAGKVPDLPQLYERAKWANPTTRDKILAAQRDAAAKEEAKRQQEKAARAQRAGVSAITGAPGSGAAVENLSLEQEIRKNVAASRARA